MSTVYNQEVARQQPCSAELTEAVERADAATTQKVDDLSVELFQALMFLQALDMFSLADEYTVEQLTDGGFFIVGEENGLPFYCVVLVDVEPNEETEVSESAESTPFIEEISDSDEPAAATPVVVPEPVLVAS